MRGSWHGARTQDRGYRSGHMPRGSWHEAPTQDQGYEYGHMPRGSWHGSAQWLSEKNQTNMGIPFIHLKL